MQYPIRTISSITGVKPVTLRAWETRYGLLRPERTESGHRLYSDDDIRRVQRALALRGRGIPIRQVPALLEQEARSQESGAQVWWRYQEEMLAAISQFDEHELDRVYQEVLSVYAIGLVIKNLIEPVLHALGQRWDTAPGGIAEEHFFSVYVSHKLEARFQHQFGNATGPLLISACLPGETHSMGLSLFCLSAHEANYRVINLGANTPLAHLSVACERRNPDAVVLASLLPPTTVVLDQLRTLVRAVTTPVFVGGQGSVSNQADIEKAGAIVLGKQTDGALQQLTQHLTSHSGGGRSAP